MPRRFLPLRLTTSPRCKERLLPVQLPKSHSLTGLIDLDRMRRAFLAVKRNRGVAGVDKVSIRAFEANLDDNLAALMFDLKHDERYRSAPLPRVQMGCGRRHPGFLRQHPP